MTVSNTPYPTDCVADYAIMLMLMCLRQMKQIMVRAEAQAIPFLAYTTPDQKSQITDNEHDCKYQFSYSKALLAVKTSQKGCGRFAGIYRLYD